MATGKNYYWIKLKEDFLKSDEVDYLMSKPNGANFVVIYEMLLISTINQQGKLQTVIGDMVVPYTLDKICRECKWFSEEQILIAMDQFAKIGLVYKDENNILAISGFNAFVGKETDYAAQKRLQRQNKKEALENKSVDTGVDNVHLPLISLSLNSLSSNNSDDKKTNKTKKKSKYEECLDKNMSLYNKYIDDYSFSEELKKSIIDWLETKSEKHKDSYADKGMKMLLSEIQNNVKAHGSDAVIQSIGKAIMNGWKGIYYDGIKDVVPPTTQQKTESGYHYREGRE